MRLKLQIKSPRDKAETLFSQDFFFFFLFLISKATKAQTNQVPKSHSWGRAEVSREARERKVYRDFKAFPEGTVYRILCCIRHRCSPNLFQPPALSCFLPGGRSFREGSGLEE